MTSVHGSKTAPQEVSVCQEFTAASGDRARAASVSSSILSMTVQAGSDLFQRCTDFAFRTLRNPISRTDSSMSEITLPYLDVTSSPTESVAESDRTDERNLISRALTAIVNDPVVKLNFEAIFVTDEWPDGAKYANAGYAPMPSYTEQGLTIL